MAVGRIIKQHRDAYPVMRHEVFLFARLVLLPPIRPDKGYLIRGLSSIRAWGIDGVSADLLFC